MKIVYECECCEAVFADKDSIKTCPVCGADACKECDDFCVCALSRKAGHELCYVKEGRYFYVPSEHEKRSCNACGLIQCDCEAS